MQKQFFEILNCFTENRVTEGKIDAKSVLNIRYQVAKALNELNEALKLLVKEIMNRSSFSSGFEIDINISNRQVIFTFVKKQELFRRKTKQENKKIVYGLFNGIVFQNSDNLENDEIFIEQLRPYIKVMCEISEIIGTINYFKIEHINEGLFELPGRWEFFAYFSVRDIDTAILFLTLSNGYTTSDDQQCEFILNEDGYGIKTKDICSDRTYNSVSLLRIYRDIIIENIPIKIEDCPADLRPFLYKSLNIPIPDTELKNLYRILGIYFNALKLLEGNEKKIDTGKRFLLEYKNKYLPTT